MSRRDWSSRSWALQAALFATLASSYVRFTASTALNALESRNETMTICLNCSDAAGCTHDESPVTYHPPVGTCFSPKALWPDDSAWGSADVLDSCVSSAGSAIKHAVAPGVGIAKAGSTGVAPSLLRREFFASTNGTCTGAPTDTFDLPLGVCVGPFGKPRPWGVFECA